MSVGGRRVGVGSALDGGLCSGGMSVGGRRVGVGSACGGGRLS